jgi:hypothetical protein
MANSFVTAKEIAERALPHLVERIKMLPLVNAGAYDGAFKKSGDVIQVKKPLRGNTADGSGDISGSYADVADESVQITLDQQRTYPVSLSSKEMTLNVDDFDRQVIVPAVTKLAEDINNSLLGLYVDIPYFYGVAGTTPDALKDLAQGRKILQDNLAPMMDRSFVMDSEAEAAFLELDSFAEVDKSGTNQALREAALGRVYGMTLASDSMIAAHTAGTYSALTDLTSDGVQTIGATTLNIESAAGTSTGTVLKGDIFTIETGAAAGQYVATANATAASGDVAVSIYPALRGATADTDTIAFADETAGAHVPNLMFQKDAFTLAMAPLEAPRGGADAAVINFGGFSIRVVNDYLFTTDKNVIRFDVLYGVKTTYPELACRVIG